MAAAVSEEYRCLVDILTCPVCRGMVSSAHICPNCSKFYCLECIIRQLAVEQTCLNCNKFLEVSMLVNCQKLCCELSQTLEKVSLKKQESTKHNHQKLSLYCGKHKLQKTYYCKTCDKPLCSDCSVLTENHRGHEFIKLSLMRNTFEAKVHEKVDEINAVQKNIEKRLELEEVIRCKKGAGNHQTLIQFEASIKLLKQELKKNLKKIMSEGEKSLEQITERLVKWNQIYDSHMSRLKSCSKGKFVEQQYDILEKQLMEVLSTIEVESQNNMDQANLAQRAKAINISYIHPVYEEFTFIIERFSEQSGNEPFFYTQSVFTTMELEWRLKIYPEGINDSKNQVGQRQLIKKSSKNEDSYFAIFIEFVSGCVETTQQKYSLSLISQSNEGRNFTREFESEFDIGECWGYEHFIKLNQIYEEDYYNRDKDELKIVLKICPSNYYQATKDQQALIHQKGKILKEREGQLKLKESSSNKALASTSSFIPLQDLV